ncbi:hypothetical protein E0702_15900, partial [Halomonas marinisediminis]
MTGNVIGGSNASTNDVADTVGADGATVSAIVSDNVGANDSTTDLNGNLVIKGEFGTLTINPDGSYTYALDNDNLVVQGLSENQTLTDTFTYTLTDGDTDTASADLVITINGTNDGVTLDV